MGQETDTFCLFLVLIVSFRILANKKRKNFFEQALDYEWVQLEQTESIWTEIGWFEHFLNPEPDILGQFSVPLYANF